MPTPDKIRGAVEAALERRQEASEEAAAQLRQAQNEASGQQAVLLGARSQLTKQEREFAECQQKLKQGVQAIIGQVRGSACYFKL